MFLHNLLLGALRAGRRFCIHYFQIDRGPLCRFQRNPSEAFHVCTNC
jgi:hypothetical protein